ncbi:MAG: DUF4118 domain-containing protein [Candidatus Binataceae bacterium]
MNIDGRRNSIGATVRHILSLLLSYIPGWIVASGPYSAIERWFIGSPRTTDFERGQMRQPCLAVDGFPGSGVTFFANALRRSAPVQSHGNSIGFLKRAFRRRCDVVVLIRHPIDACSYAKSHSKSRIPDRLRLLEWIRYYGFVQRHRTRPVMLDFMQFAYDSNPLTTNPALADLIWRRGWRYEPNAAPNHADELEMIRCGGVINQHLLQRAMEIYRDLSAEARGEQPEQREPRIVISPLADRLLNGYSGAVAFMFPIIAVALASAANLSRQVPLPGGIFGAFMAVTLASALLGLIPGIIATALSGASAAYTLDPPDSFAIASRTDQINLCCFVLVSLLCIAVITMMIRRAYLPDPNSARRRSGPAI